MRTIAEIPDEKAKRVHLSLYHNHIPKLEEANLVRYETDQQTVALSDYTERLEKCWE